VDSAFVDGLHVALLIGGGLMLVAAASPSSCSADLR
jgi:hypothetical protein